MDVLADLIQCLSLKKLETNVYEGQNQDLGFPRVFGGQVLGQALMAASYTVDQRQVHSLHAYFLRPGDLKVPIYYEVDLIRSGASFSTRRVVAKQHGRAIFNMSASFQQVETGFEHQAPKPNVPGPEGLSSELELTRKIQDKIPPKVRDKFLGERPIEIRVLDPIDYFNPHKRPAVKYSWLRTAGSMPDDPIIHQAMLAYASDFGFSTTALLPHGVSFLHPQMQIASLDHAMWFHRPFRMDEWLLHSKDSPSASGGRGFNRGQIFSQNGDLIASVAQEGLIRLHDS